MIHLRDTWQQVVQDVPRVEEDFSPVVHLPPHADALLLSDLTPQTVQRWMADATVDEPGADTKMAAAYLMGDVANTVCQVFAALALRGHWLAAAGTGSVGLIPRFVPWNEDRESGVSMTFDICLAPDALAIGRGPVPTALPSRSKTCSHRLSSTFTLKAALASQPFTGLWATVLLMGS